MKYLSIVLLISMALLNSGSVRAMESGGAAARSDSADERTLVDDAIAGDCAAMQRHIDAGAPVNHVNQYGHAPLLVAVAYGHLEAVDMLLGVPGIDVNIAGTHGWTPLIVAVRHGDIAMVRRLVDAQGIELDRTDRFALTPLQWAVSQEEPACVSALVRAGARVTDAMVSVNGVITTILNRARRAQTARDKEAADALRAEIANHDHAMYGGRDPWDEEGHLKAA